MGKKGKCCCIPPCMFPDIDIPGYNPLYSWEGMGYACCWARDFITEEVTPPTTNYDAGIICRSHRLITVHEEAFGSIEKFEPGPVWTRICTNELAATNDYKYYRYQDQGFGIEVQRSRNLRLFLHLIVVDSIPYYYVKLQTSAFMTPYTWERFHYFGDYSHTDGTYHIASSIYGFLRAKGYGVQPELPPISKIYGPAVEYQIKTCGLIPISELNTTAYERFTIEGEDEEPDVDLCVPWEIQKISYGREFTTIYNEAHDKITASCPEQSGPAESYPMAGRATSPGFGSASIGLPSLYYPYISHDGIFPKTPSGETWRTILPCQSYSSGGQPGWRLHTTAEKTSDVWSGFNYGLTTLEVGLSVPIDIKLWP